MFTDTPQAGEQFAVDASFGRWYNSRTEAWDNVWQAGAAIRAATVIGRIVEAFWEDVTMRRVAISQRIYTRRGFTLIELLVVIAVIAVLMAILMPALQRAREQGKRAVCLNNTKSLVTAWLMYADENEGKLPGAQASESLTDEDCWVRKPEGTLPVEAPVEEQLKALQDGVLYPYAPNVKVFRCPVAAKNEMRTYSIVHGMNGYDFGGIAPMCRRIQDVKQPGTRIVFIDDYGEDYDAAWAVHYDQPKWWNPIPMRHGKGTVASHADGHAVFYSWTDPRTIEWAQLTWAEAEAQKNDGLTTQPGNQDLQEIQKGAWGKLGYEL